MSHSRKQQQQTFNTHSRFTAGRASHDTSALCRELNAAGSADTEQTCCCLFFLSVFMFCLGFFFGPTLFYILMCRRLSQWHFSHASAFRPHGRHQYTHLICQPQYFSVTLALQRALGLQPFAPTSPPPCDFVMLSERVLTDITGVKLFILKADTALRMQLQSNIRTQTWHEAQESIQRGQL